MTIRLETDEDERQYALLTAPAGEPQSGLARYAAAMHFHMRGMMTDDGLERYRILCKQDRETPPPPAL